MPREPRRTCHFVHRQELAAIPSDFDAGMHLSKEKHSARRPNPSERNLQNRVSRGIQIKLRHFESQTNPSGGCNMTKISTHLHSGPKTTKRRRKIVRELAAGIRKIQKRHELRNLNAKGLDVARGIVLSGESKRPSQAKKTSRPGVRST
jgi:hypothetical protein